MICLSAPNKSIVHSCHLVLQSPFSLLICLLSHMFNNLMVDFQRGPVSVKGSMSVFLMLADDAKNQAVIQSPTRPT